MMFARFPAAIPAALCLACAFSLVSAAHGQLPPAESVVSVAPVAVLADGQSVEIRSKNFLVCGTTEKIAQRVAVQAEKHRKSLAEHWLGKELPDWPRPCRIEVRVDDGQIGGVTTSDFAVPAESWAPLRIGLTGSVDRILNNILPHEMTHAVLADHFRRPLPKWADEGAAVMGDDAGQQKNFERMARDLWAPGKLYCLSYLLPLAGYPEQVGVLYAQGYSVTRFLIGRKDRETFLAFVRTGMDGDWTAAVRQYYGYESLDDLQAAWLATVVEEPAK